MTHTHTHRPIYIYIYIYTYKISKHTFTDRERKNTMSEIRNHSPTHKHTHIQRIKNLKKMRGLVG